MNAMTTFARESRRRLHAMAYFSFVLSQVAGLVASTATVLAASYFIPVLIGIVLAIGASFLVNSRSRTSSCFESRRAADGGFYSTSAAASVSH